MSETQSRIRHRILRAVDAFGRRPGAAVQEDAPATAVWDGGLATRLQHPDGAPLRTDMPQVLGGAAGAPSPGWFLRAGVASCLATSIAIEAAMRGVVLQHLEVQARSESDARGMLGMPCGVPAGPLRIWLVVRVHAEAATHQALREIVATAHARAPMSDSLRRAMDLPLELHVGPAAGA